MLLRIVAAVAAVGPTLLVFAAPWPPQTILAAALGLAALGLVVLALGHRREVAGVGIVLAVVATLLAPTVADLLPVTGIGSGVPLIDLATDDFPEPSPRYASVRGLLRDAWTLDEYATAAGNRPKQTEAAPAVLVPFVGTEQDIVQFRGAVVVARLTPDAPRSANWTTITGRVVPLPEEARVALVAVAIPSEARAQVTVRGVVIDTLDVPRPAEAWTRLVLLALLVLGALGCLQAAAGTGASSRGV